MKILSDKKQLIKLVNFEKNLGFVPTMGGIHKGHLSLINKSINECEKTIVSIYINKPHTFYELEESIEGEQLRLRYHRRQMFH